ncbi:MAG: hypothetical protein LBH59_10620 [Planctomycetaceae bacterium]|jgi:hypothetical protein|nr:hypothetical protein [Planctomycetaceae bacterium]
MENSNNDRWSLLAADLGIEVDSKKIENNTNKTEIESVKQNALVVVPPNAVAKITTTEPKVKDATLTSTTTTPQTSTTPTTKILPTDTPTHAPTHTPTQNSGNTNFDNQKKKFTTNTTKPSGNSSNNFNKPNTTKNHAHVTHSTASNSSFGAGILEPDEIAKVAATKNVNTTSTSTSTTNTITSADLSDKNNFARNNSAGINVTKNQIHDSTMKPNEFTEDKETFKPEPVKRSFFERLQQINIFGTRNRNDNTIKNADENNTTTNEYNNDDKKVNGDVQSEREHLPHGRYLPPHAQALYKAHTQSHPPTQQKNSPQSNQQDQTQNSDKDVFDPLRQIATQISKLGDGAAKNETQKTETQTRNYNQNYKKSPPNYYNNSTDKTNRHYSNAQNNINDSPESLFDDDLQETEEFAALRRLIGDDLPVEDEAQRRLASLLGEPKEESQPPQQVEQTLDNRAASPYQRNRVSRYPNNRNHTQNNHPNNTRPENNTNKRWTPPTNNQTDKSTIVRGRRGSRFKGNNQKIDDGINQNETNQPNIPHNQTSQSTYQSQHPSSTFAGQYWQTNSSNDSSIPQNGKPTTQTTGHNIKQDQNWRGRRQPDNRNTSNMQNDQTRYNNSQYLPALQSQPQNVNYTSQVVNDIGAVDADYIDEYGEGVVSDAERLSFAQAHKNIPSWNDAIESIVDANIQRHTRHYQNTKRR